KRLRRGAAGLRFAPASIGFAARILDWCCCATPGQDACAKSARNLRVVAARQLYRTRNMREFRAVTRASTTPPARAARDLTRYVPGRRSSTFATHREVPCARSHIGAVHERPAVKRPP